MENEDTRVISESPKFLDIEDLQKKAFNAGLEAALESLPEMRDPRSIDAGNEIYQRIGDSPAANFRHGFKLGQGLALDQAKKAIEKARRG